MLNVYMNLHEMYVSLQCLVGILRLTYLKRMVIIVWLDFAFSPSKVPVSSESILIFLDFYLKLSRDREDALLFLNDERHKRKLGHLLDGSHSALRDSNQVSQQNIHFTRDTGNAGSKATSRGNFVQNY